MAVTSSTSKPFSDAEQQELLRLARRSIEHGIERGRPLPVDLAAHGESLREQGAAFVTLHWESRLRGCIGNLIAHQPLVIEVVDNAYSAAFRDPRFQPLRAEEFDALHVEISVLTPRSEIRIGSEAELLEALRPHEDGIVLEEGYFLSTFLPSVWEQLPDKREFLQQLKRKAGLPADYWSPTLKVYRYGTVSFGE